ncbi:MAG: APC family permease [Leptolyngbyaceae cyanobacterium SM1_3_5]|nr:APC family permease [Leptolyngbyaceae cyanobacterium SM1_3_5]
MLGVGLTVGIVFSCFSCCLASINAASRIAYALARHSFFPAPLGVAHTRNQTPHVAVSVSALLAFLIPGSMLLFGMSDTTIYGYLGTISTYGFLTAYLLVSIAAPVYLSQRGELRSQHVIISILAGFFMLIPVAGSFYPIPAFPYNIFPYFFLLYLAAGGWLFSTLGHRAQIIRNIEDDGEAVQAQLTD